MAALLWVYYPADSSHSLAAVCRVKAKSYYVLNLGGKDTLCLYDLQSGHPKSALRPEMTDDSVDVSGVFVSNVGHVLTTDSLVRRQNDTIDASRLKQILQQLDTLTAHKIVRHKAELEELDDYARTHTVVDDGYDAVMSYRDSIGHEVLRLDTLLQKIKKVSDNKKITVKLCHTVSVQAADTLFAARIVLRKDGLAVIQLNEGLLPHGAARCSVYRFGTYRFGARLFAFNDFGGETAAPNPVELGESDALCPATEGGAWINASGHLSGMRRGMNRVSSWQIARTLRAVHAWPVWWWVNIKAHFTRDDEDEKPIDDKPASAVQASELVRCLRVELSDTSVYEGQVIVKDGKTVNDSTGMRPVRHGYGTLRMRNGTICRGQWQADTLVCGTRVDSAGVYSGRFNAALRPEGQGTMCYRNGTYYRGEWKNGVRSGHGFCVRAGRMVQCGEWKHNSFWGERMVYTANRIYGIDISRYQHEKGRKKYKIDWTELRITSLGAGRRVQGNVNYPVSFVYIKSTEGRSVRNKYYMADWQQIRKSGIPVGAYHFFSTTSSGAQQARHFMKYTRVAANDLPPVLDLEPTEAQIGKMGGDASMFREVRVWLQSVENRYGKRPVLYVSQTFVNKHLCNAPDLLQKYEVWIARYGEYKPYVRLLHWQLTPYGRVKGIQPAVDINVFNGTKDEFDSYLKSHGVRK